MEDYLIYDGEHFEVEWYNTINGRSQASEFYKELNNNDRIQFLKLVVRIGDFGIIRNKTKFRNEGNKIYTFKPQPNRFLCFFAQGKKIIVTNAFIKKSNRLPAKEKEKALRYRKDYLDRCESGNYYEE